jgi:hypothetical protein
MIIQGVAVGIFAILAIIMFIAVYDSGMTFLNMYSAQIQKWLLFRIAFISNHRNDKHNQYRYNGQPKYSANYPPNPCRPFHNPFDNNEYNEDYENNSPEFNLISTTLIRHCENIIRGLATKCKQYPLTLWIIC